MGGIVLGLLRGRSLVLARDRKGRERKNVCEREIDEIL